MLKNCLQLLGCRLVTLVTVVAATLPLKAGEKVIVVADMETHIPIRDVLIMLDNGDRLKIDWSGRFVLYHQKFGRAIFSHPDYLKRVMDSKEFTTDTIFLIPLHRTLSEVVVTADAPKIHPQIFNSIRIAAATYGQKPSGRDFLSLLRPKDRKRRKLGEKTRKALEDY